MPLNFFRSSVGTSALTFSGPHRQFQWVTARPTSNSQPHGPAAIHHFSKQEEVIMVRSRSISLSSLGVALISGWLALPCFAKGTNTPSGSDQVSTLLLNAEAQAFQLRADADELEGYSRSNASWQSHAEAIDRIREDVNKMGDILNRLEQNRSKAAPWQQVAISRVVPVARELAANTTAAIDHLNRNPNRLNTPRYQEYLEAIVDSADNLSSTIKDAVDYGRTKQRLDRLAARLELPEGK